MAGIYITTLDGRFVDCNDSMAAMLGYASRAELLSRPAGDLYFSATDREEFVARLSKTGALANSELRLRRKDGSPIDILENVTLLRDGRGAPAMIQGTMIDVTQRKRAARELRSSERRYRKLAAELRRLTHHLHTLREEQRATIARELHDELAQALTALSIDLQWLRQRLPARSGTILDRLTAMGDLVGATLDSVRRMCAELRPTLLDELGLKAAIEWQIHEFQKRTGIRCDLSLPDEPIAPTGEQATDIYRILQEALTNIARHSRATAVRVNLALRDEKLRLTVADNGQGIASSTATGRHRFGLLGMRERAVRWDGRLTVRGVAGRGTTVTLCLPLARRKQELGA